MKVVLISVYMPLKALTGMSGLKDWNEKCLTITTWKLVLKNWRVDWAHLGWRKRLVGGQKGNGGEGRRGAGKAGGLSRILMLCIVVVTKVLPFYLLSCLVSSSDCCSSWVNCGFGCRPSGSEGNGSLSDSLFILLKRVLSSRSRMNVANDGIYSVVSSFVGFSNVVWTKNISSGQKIWTRSDSIVL